jgi:diguanylate cyclase (GGDEF)-like protein
MDRNSGLFSSAIGRRLLLLFVIAAFVPVAAMMLIALTKVDTTLKAALDEELVQSAKAYGMQLIDRLARQEHEFVVADDANGWQELQRDVRAQLGDFVGLGRVTNTGALARRTGDLPADIGVDASAIANLADGKTALAVAPGAQGRLLLLRRRAEADGPSASVAAPNMRRVWGNPDTYPPQTDFCIATASGILLHCSRPIALPSLDWRALSHGGAQSLRWEDDGEPLRAAAWTLFIESRFAGEDWVILAIQPERYALRPVQSFRAAFVPVGVLALLLVILVSTNQIRRILTPLQQLLAGTFRMGRQDFYPRVEVESRDEFGQLAGAFNDMADRLGLQFRMFAAFAEIDRTLLTTLDLSDVSATATRCIQEIAGVDIVSIALIEPGTSDRLRLYSVAGMDAATWAGAEFRCNSGPFAAIQPLQWTAEPPLPPPLVALLRNAGAREFALLPVARGNVASGVAVLAHSAARPIAIEQAAQIGGVVDRIAIALEAVVRDRKLYEQAHFDALTGLPNRYHLLSLLAQSLARAQRQGVQVAVLFVDLDNFKRTNDTLGHAAGDALLQAAALRIRGALREGDLVARLGGDEFTVVLDQLGDPRAVGAIARKVIEVLSHPFPLQGQDMYVGASIGIAVYPSDGATAEDLLKQADTAMYRAKALGRGGVAFFEDKMNAEASERARVDRELRLALQRDEFVLHYQPQLNLRTGRPEGVEALVRWQHPERGLLAPGAFIEVAEENGLIDAIGGWVLDRACSQMAQWRSDGLVIQHMAVNVSARQLLRPDFFTRVQVALGHNALEPEAVVLEVTESLFADAGAVEVLKRLQRLGVGIAVDDFGTGYSSFAYLRTLPISILKIDRTFIVDVATNAAAATIVAAIIKMAQALHKEVVAEGVEDADQIAFLQRAGCDHLQGYAISRPVDAGALERFVHAAGSPPAAAGLAQKSAPDRHEESLGV